MGRRRVRRAVSGCRSSRPTRGCCCPIRTKCRRSSSASSARRRSSRRSFARTPRARCCCRSAGPACARRCGSSASAPPICWPWRRGTDRFRSCSKPIANACATSSTCRRSISTLTDVRSRKIRVATVDSEKPSPFAASLLFSYVASFLYDGDAPLAERRAQALAVDQAQLRELLGDAELRELLDADSMDAIERQLQRLDPQYRARSADAVHDMLLAIGDLTSDELLARVLNVAAAESVDVLVAARRDSAGAHRRRAAVHRGRGRRALSRRPRRAAAGRPSRVAAAAGARSARRSGACDTRGRTRRSPPQSSPRATRSVRSPPKRC